MLDTLVTVIHCFFVCPMLIIIVLLQQGKGADMGATFGGGSNTVFGASGADNLLTRVTTVLAVVFMCTSLYLAASLRPSSGLSGSVLTGSVVTGNAPTPPTSAGAPAAGSPVAEAPVAGAPTTGGAVETAPTTEAAPPAPVDAPAPAEVPVAPNAASEPAAAPQ